MKGVKSGFTLIELLIVVAIIAILAAIAVPNFIEAQVRSKVARARADMRSLATAMESYRVDSSVYPSYTAMGANKTTIFPERTRDLNGFTQGIPLSFPWVLKASREGHDRNEWFYTWSTTFITAPLVASTGFFPNLTTPVAFITSFPPDPFGFENGSPFSYFHTHKHTAWMIYSCGPRQMLGMTSSMHQNYNRDTSICTGTNVPANDPYLVLDPRGGNPNNQLLAGTAIQGDDVFHGAHTYDATNGTKSAGNIWRVGP